MNLQRPPRTTPKEMTKFHTDDYVNFLRTVTPDNMNEYSKQLTRCKFSHCLKNKIENVGEQGTNLIFLNLFS